MRLPIARLTVPRSASRASFVRKLANSAAFGFSREISDIQHAIALLGFRQTQALALSIYDPNHPRKEVELTMNFRDPARGIGARQSTGEKLRGFFVIGES